MKLIFSIKTQNRVSIQLLQGKRVVGQQSLTISQGFDNMLITTLDKLLAEFKMDRLRLKSAQILGKVEDKALWGMILKTINQALLI